MKREEAVWWSEANLHFIQCSTVSGDFSEPEHRRDRTHISMTFNILSCTEKIIIKIITNYQFWCLLINSYGYQQFTCISPFSLSSHIRLKYESLRNVILDMLSKSWSNVTANSTGFMCKDVLKNIFEKSLWKRLSRYTWHHFF